MRENRKDREIGKMRGNRKYWEGKFKNENGGNRKDGEIGKMGK